MRTVFALAFLLAMCGCSQEYLDRKAAERDAAFCQSMGISASDSRYADCRMSAAQMRAQQTQHDQAIGLGMLGYGSNLYQSSHPTYARPMTCVQQGTVTTCQ
jgi:hypothetical protein